MIKRVLACALPTAVMVASGLAMVPVPAAAVAGVPVFGLTHDLGNAGGEPSIQDDGQGRL
jgi:hypothetical protein